MRGAYVVAVVLLVVGCAQRADPNLYVIAPAADAVNRNGSGSEPLVAVARVSLPEYLDRSAPTPWWWTTITAGANPWPTACPACCPKT